MPCCVALAAGGLERRHVKRHHSSGEKEFNPETLALGYGYDPFLSEGSLKPPVFLTSTFQFKSASEGKRFFEIAYGLDEKKSGEVPGLIYSRQVSFIT